jgi:hypothetical protein
MKSGELTGFKAQVTRLRGIHPPDFGINAFDSGLPEWDTEHVPGNQGKGQWRRPTCRQLEGKTGRDFNHPIG